MSSDTKVPCKNCEVCKESPAVRWMFDIGDVCRECENTMKQQEAMLKKLLAKD
jgi:hypothetical protein